MCNFKTRLDISELTNRLVLMIQDIQLTIETLGVVPAPRWNENFKKIVGINKYLSDAVSISISGVTYYIWFQDMPIANEDGVLEWQNRGIDCAISHVRGFDFEDGEWHDHYEKIESQETLDRLVSLVSEDAFKFFSVGNI